MITDTARQYIVSKETPAVFHNNWKYDYYFIIRELGEELEGQFECLGENNENAWFFQFW